MTTKETILDSAIPRGLKNAGHHVNAGPAENPALQVANLDSAILNPMPGFCAQGFHQLPALFWGLLEAVQPGDGRG
ncbi:hypothetical protein [Rhodoferax sp. WC2427]|uniref:hypothetical protein n=1 Tax=Rhodoferax sp. WC2427 TaxID=3234144 RepID=UPI00346569BE